MQEGVSKGAGWAERLCLLLECFKINVKFHELLYTQFESKQSKHKIKPDMLGTRNPESTWHVVGAP